MPRKIRGRGQSVVSWWLLAGAGALPFVVVGCTVKTGDEHAGAGGSPALAGAAGRSVAGTGAEMSGGGGRAGSTGNSGAGRDANGAGGEAGGDSAAGAGGQPANGAVAGAGGEGGVSEISCESPSDTRETLVNGSFEFPEANDIVSVDEGAEPEGFGWSVTTNGVEVVKVGYTHAGSTWSSPAYEGDQFLDLVGIGSTGAIAQTVLVTPGVRYTLTFAYSDNAGIMPRGASARVSVSDCGGVLSSTVISHDTASLTDADWSVGRLKFVARSSSVKLEFVTTEARGNGGILLDGIELDAAD